MKKVSFFGNEMVSGLSDKSLNNLIEGQSGKIWVAIFNVKSTGCHKNILTYNDNNLENLLVLKSSIFLTSKLIYDM